jgi:hypothetical protein
MPKSNPIEKTHWSQPLVILGIILFAVAIALWQMVPPNVIPATAPLTEFSADRAIPDLKAISQAPHPIGSAAHTAVREYLMTQLKAMGLQPEVQTEISPGSGSCCSLLPSFLALSYSSPSRSILALGWLGLRD